MANVGPARSKSARRRWATAIACSLMANSFVVYLFWELRVAPVYDSTPATTVQLMPRLQPTGPGARPAKRASTRSPPRPHISPLFAPPASTRAPGEVASSGPSVAPSADVAGPSVALRGVLGCDLANPTDAERASCAERLA